MHRHTARHRLFALTLGLAALLAGCGGGDALPPGASPLTPAPDTTAPTVTIVSGSAGSTATGAVTFTFTFSENVGTSFNADDVVVVGGSKGTFAMPSGTSATLVVTPNAGASGSLDASVAAGRYSDLAGNLNTATAAASQAYNTVAGALGSGSTGSCTAAPCVDFGTAGLAMVPFGGMAAEVVADPGDAANKTIKLVKVPAAEVWAGATLDPSGTGVAKVAAFDFATSKTVTLRFLSPAAGETIMLKVENAADNTVLMEAQATTTQANQWETLTFNFAAPSLGSFDASKTYDRVSIFPHYNTKVAADTTYYADELKYTAVGAGSGGGGATSGSTGTCTAAPCVDFGGAGLAMVPFGALAAEIAADPSDAANKVAKLVKVPASEVWAGATVDPTGNAAQKVPAFDFATSKAVTLRFRAPAAGEVIMLKAENAADGNVFVEAQATTTQANQWETLTFNFAAPTNGSIDPAKTYDRVSIFPHFGTKVAADTTYYADELKYTAVAAAGGGSVACGTIEPTCAPTGSVPAGAVVIYSDAAQVANFDPKPDWGQAPAVTYSQVNIAGNNSLKYGFTAPALYEGLDWSASPVNVSAKGKLHIDFWSANVSSVKVSIISTEGGPKESAVTQAVTAGSWNSVDIDLALFTVPDKTKITQIKLEPNVGGTLFVDNIYFWGAAPAAGPAVVFSSGFGGSNATVEGGGFGGYSGSSLDGFNCNGQPSSCGSGGTFAPAAAAAASSFFYYYQTPSPVTELFAGIFVQAPGLTTGLSATADTPGISIAGKTTMKFNLGQNPEWFAAPNRNVGVILTLGKFYDVNPSTPIQNCNIKLLAVVTPSAAASTAYSVPMSAFQVIQSCNVAGLTTTAALALSPLSQVDFQAVGSGNPLPTVGGKLVGANMSVGVGSPAVYPSTLALTGGITFE